MNTLTLSATLPRAYASDHFVRLAPGARASLILAAGLLASAGLAMPALGQGSFDVEKQLDLQLASSPGTVHMDWKHKERAVARVGVFCRQAHGSIFASTVQDVPSSTPLDVPETAEAGRNNRCTASAEALADWELHSFTSFTLATRALGATNPVADRCVGRKDKPARARSRAKSVLKMHVSGGTVGTKGFSASWVNSQNALPGSRQRQKQLKDPVVASLYDLSGTLLGQWDVISIDSRVFGTGQTSMFTGDQGLTIANNAPDMDLRIEIGSSIVAAADRGVIQVTVQNGVVIQSVLTGRFANVLGIPAVNAAGTAWQAHIDMSGIHYDMQVPQGTPVLVEIDMGGSSHGVSEDGLVAPVCSLVSNLDQGFDEADVSVVPVGDSGLGYSCRLGDSSVLEDLTTTTEVQPDFVVVPYYIEGAAPGTAPTAVYVRLYNGNPAAGGTLIYDGASASPSFDVEDIEAYRVLPTDLLNTSRSLSEAVIDLSAAPVVPANTHLWVEVWMDYPGSAVIGVPSSPFSDNAVDNAMGYSFTTGQYSTLTDPSSGRHACIPIEFFGLPPEPCSADFDGDGDVGTDADIEAFFACLGGNCCQDCESADFNGDGDVGTDADIESFFRVLAGGSC